MSVVLSDHLPLLAAAPDGIQKLRGLILELAVRGKLVPQDPSDEPASELLKRIAKERARLEADGTCKKSKATPVRTEEHPFDAPDGWAWVRLTQVGEFRGGKTPSTNHSKYWDGSIPWVSPKDMKSLVVSKTEDYVSDLAISDGLSLIPASSVLIVVRSGILRRTVPVAINSLQCTVNQDLKALCLVLPDMAQYVQLQIRGFERLILETLTKVGTTVESIKFEEFSAQPFPLPPLAEQHRIVAKVDELMALCDRLEQEVGAGGTAHAKLVETLLGTLTQSTDADDLAANWQRLAEHFDTLFTTEASIDALKQTILQLAVMGKLVPQDPDDEQSEIPVANIGGVEMPYDVPHLWKWLPTSDLAELVTDGEHATPTRIHEHQVPLVTAKNVRDGVMDYTTTDWVSVETAEKAWRRCQPLVGDILLVCVGATTGRLCILRDEKDMVLVRSVALIRPSKFVDVEYLAVAIRSPLGQSQIWSSVKVTAQPCLYINRINALVFPLPPLAEQHRIVAKVDELLALCNRLKADLAESRTRQDRLATTLIESALQAA